MDRFLAAMLQCMSNSSYLLSASSVLNDFAGGSPGNPTDMDSYTARTKEWLEERFRTADESGIYVAHQPIYGFRKGHSEPCHLERYILTYQIMKALSCLKFTTLLDVGGAEGYKSFLASRTYSVWAASGDLSEQACKRAREIFSSDSFVADIHDLPFRDSAFDVVLCSETLEHVTDIQRATLELLRVAGKAVVITVPLESHLSVERNIEQGIPHAHIHTIDAHAFDFAASKGRRVVYRRMLSAPGRRLHDLLEPAPKEPDEKYPKFVYRLYNALVPALRRLAGRRAMALAIMLDSLIGKTPASCGALLCVVVKAGSTWNEGAPQRVTARQIVDFEVPHHFLR